LGASLLSVVSTKSRIRHGRLGVALIVAFLLTMIGTAHADILYTFGFSPRGMGMGNAMTAIADDWAAPFYNPAGTAFQTQPSVGFGYFIGDSSINAIGIDEISLGATRGMLYGANLPLPFRDGIFKDRLAFGFAGFMPEGMLIRMGVDAPTDPTLILLGNANRSSVMIPTLGVKITEGLAIGGGVQSFVDTKGEIYAYIDPSGAVQTKVGEELVMVYFPIASVLFRPGKHWDSMRGWGFGFVYRDQQYTDYLIPISAALGDIPFIVSFAAKSLFLPRQYIGAVSYDGGRWRVEADVAFNEWSEFPDPHLIIKNDVSIPIIPIEFTDSVAHPPKFHDTVTGKAGAEFDIYRHADVDMFLRGGYQIDPSPVPPQTGYTNQLDSDRHVGALSYGLTWKGVGDFRFNAPIKIDTVGQVQYLTRRVSYKNDDVDPSNPGYPKIGMEGWLYSFGLSLSTQFDYE